MSEQELKSIGQSLVDIMEELKRKGNGDTFHIGIDDDDFVMELVDRREFRYWFTTGADMSLDEALIVAHHKLRK